MCCAEEKKEVFLSHLNPPPLPPEVLCLTLIPSPNGIVVRIQFAPRNNKQK